MIISLRLGCNDHKNPDYIKTLIKTIKDSGNCFDEVWLATSYALPDRVQTEKDAADMAVAADIFRKAGIKASMQISRTIGHHENSLYSYPCGADYSAFDLVADIDNNKNNGVFCWNNEAFRDYWCETLSQYAGFQPDRIWIDDDIRLRLIGPSKALCFCDHCIELFNKRIGASLDRKSLKEKFITVSDFRKQYIDFQTETIDDFANVLFTSLHKVSPCSIPCLQNGGNTSLPIGVQQRILQTMKTVTGLTPSFRSGGGFYNDHNPTLVLDKFSTLNYMNSRVRKNAENLSCEIENLPHTAYGKSMEFTCIEAAFYLAAGCNELSVTLMNRLEDLSFTKEEFADLATYRPFFEKYLDYTSDTVNAGISIYQPDDSILVPMNGDMLPFWNDTCIWNGSQLMCLGIPFHSSPEGSSYLITEKTADYLSKSDLEFLANQTVLTDTNTLYKLQKRGVTNPLLCELRALDKYENIGLAEIMCNEKAKPIMQRYLTSSVSIIPEGENIKSLSKLYQRRSGKEIGNGISVIPTVSGGKWVVSSQNILDTEMAFSRRETLRLALKEAGASLEAFVSDPKQIAIIPRKDNENRVTSLMLINVSVTASREFSVQIKCPYDVSAILIRPGEEDVPLELKPNGEYKTAVLPSLAGWNCCAICLSPV